MICPAVTGHSTLKQAQAHQHDMSKKKNTFSAFGIKYRTEQFSAIRGLEMLARPDDIHPCELLAQTEVLTPHGEWVSLADQDAVNIYVADAIGIIAPRMALKGVLALVEEYNFKFMNGWRAVKVPTRFTDGAAMVKSSNIDPMASQLIQDGVATLKELEDYYSLEDAFKLFDTIMIKGVNAALSHESSMKKTKRG